MYNNIKLKEFKTMKYLVLGVIVSLLTCLSITVAYSKITNEYIATNYISYDYNANIPDLQYFDKHWVLPDDIDGTSPYDEAPIDLLEYLFN